MLAPSFLSVFDRDFAPHLGPREPTFRAVLSDLIASASCPLIVETGCIRVLGNWYDGQSTILFDRFIKSLGGGVVWSVNIDPEAVAVARSVTDARIACGDSIEFLAKLSSPIDLLYLDSFDFDQRLPMESAMHHLYELTAANRCLRSGSIVMVDDTSRLTATAYYGKGMMVGPYLDRIGAKIIAEGKAQIAWKLP